MHVILKTISFVTILMMSATLAQTPGIISLTAGSYSALNATDPTHSYDLVVLDDGAAIDQYGHYLYFDESIGAYCHVEAPAPLLTMCIRFFEDSTYEIIALNTTHGLEAVEETGNFVENEI